MATLTIEHPERIWQLRLVMLLLVIAGCGAVWFVLQWKTAEPTLGTDSPKTNVIETKQ
jgi:hypothetical protein